ncbi:hypothetical protein GCM10010442_11260 [Kitasatospora kifunensis]
MAVRTETSLYRMLDVVPLFAGDKRVDLSFTVVPGSDFGHRLPALLDAAGMPHLPWSKAVDSRAHLALAASPNGDLHRLRAPLMLVPHGAGFNKRLTTTAVTTSQQGEQEEQDAPEASGLSARQLLHQGRVTASLIGLAHPDQLKRLARSCPPAAAHARVIGDPCLDRMLAGRARREAYRRALGGGDGRRLIVLSSTWGKRSLYESLTALPARLLAELPYDEYRVVLALHPNVWAQHSPWLVRHWLADALDAGLVLLAPDEGWRAAVVAADCVIGDHGSVALYAAALDRPVMLVGDGGREVVPGSPLTTLAALAPGLDPGAELREQVARAVEGYRPGALRGAADQTFDLVGGSAGALRSLMYGVLGLAEPARAPAVRALPAPDPALRPAAALQTWTRITARRPDGLTVLVERFPAAVEQYATREAHPEARVHLLVDVDRCDDLRLLQNAVVVLGSATAAGAESNDPDDGAERAAALLAQHPRARAAAVTAGPGRLRLSLRNGPSSTVSVVPGTSSTDAASTPTPPAPSTPTSTELAVAASALYAACCDRQRPVPEATRATRAAGAAAGPPGEVTVLIGGRRLRLLPVALR